MCGRYASSRGAEYLVNHFDVVEPPEQVLPPSWNVAPTDPAHVVAVRHGRRGLHVARWGLEPAFLAGRRGRPLINARRETVASMPAFRAAFARRRCLVPADGYYEWQPQDGHGPAKQAWYLTSRDGAPLAMAGLYEVRRDGEQRCWTCAVITTSAPDQLGAIHDRTPLLVPRSAWSRWLDPQVTHPGDDLLLPGVAGLLNAWPVAAAVGNVRNDGPELVAPAPTLTALTAVADQEYLPLEG